MTEIEKTLNGIVEIELKSGKYEMTLNHRAIAYIYEKYDQEPIEFIYEFNKTVKKGTEKLKDELAINNKIAKRLLTDFSEVHNTICNLIDSQQLTKYFNEQR
jgi:predicted regulator of amino acid metabolism with ACT domain